MPLKKMINKIFLSSKVEKVFYNIYVRVSGSSH